MAQNPFDLVPCAWSERAQAAPSGAGRFTSPIDGVRYYPIPGPSGGQLFVPGVTSVLSDDSEPADRERLENWRAKEIAAGRDPNHGRNRGTATHGLLEDYVRGIDFRTGDNWRDEEPARFASGMERHLAPYQEFIWNERPLVNGWDHCWSEPDQEGNKLARVWSHVWGFAGTPDLIAKRRNGLTILSDFKTSNQPYYRCSGKPVPQYKKIGWLKYKKTVRQLCAYKLAIEETLGLHIDNLQIIVGLPEIDRAQMFFIRKHEIELETRNFKNSIVKFWNRRAQPYEQVNKELQLASQQAA